VEDINDHKPVFEETAYTTEVRESVSVGSTVLTVRASDKDAGKNGEILYSIKSQSSKPDVFRIDPKTGVVSTRLPLDREKEASHSLVVEATDQVNDVYRYVYSSVPDPRHFGVDPDPDPRIHASD
jgi:cadherin EGF LAG seven-pass G-type receptor 1